MRSRGFELGRLSRTKLAVLAVGVLLLASASSVLSMVSAAPGTSTIATTTAAATATGPTTATSIVISCRPSSEVVGSSDIGCVAEVKGGGPNGKVTWSQVGGTGSVSFLPASCTLAKNGRCRVTVKGTGAGTADVQATYGKGSTATGSSSNVVGLKISKFNARISVKCSPNSVAIGQSTVCTAVVTGFSPTGTMNWAKSGGTGKVSTLPQSCSLSKVVVSLSSSSSSPSYRQAECSVTLTGTGAGRVEIEAKYSGDSNNDAAQTRHWLKVQSSTTITTSITTVSPVATTSSATG